MIPIPRRTRASKCAHCHEPTNHPRRKYHAECREPALAELSRTRKRCGKCGKMRSRRSFPQDVGRSDGLFPWCKSCHVKYQTEGKFQNPDAPLTGKICPLCDTPLRGQANRKYCGTSCCGRASKLRKQYGMAVAEYRRLLADADGLCPICKCRPSRWNVDHNHKTGLATGICCTRCNTGLLAFSNHDPELAQRLADYLKGDPGAKAGYHRCRPGGGEGGGFEIGCYLAAAWGAA